MYSRLLRRFTARRSGTGLVPVGPTKVKTRKSILFTEGTLEIKINRNFNSHLQHLIRSSTRLI